ncbi:hypothetical protein NLM33_25130 [Bradyrhizobium sp. CCGUVB1N3]|uniref:hypothetical protein n=1 Tax=Bradyrhizobium sp. CCGUVB1N3 TaxID=2949629 RepID=UPI0020B2A1F0|nr:hypothetical protein [Bradyrhizobium sp. CCGUVB1N3]MCP3471820.1 hypothetical protein [Bradyrhizobium sp. CCGUVB1N3]MCP3473602.1 hypothetical protein [Bradyrhizobium sp. CCGUVB1N3]
MLVVTVEIFPGGFETARRTVGTLRIANESNLADVSDYQVVAIRSANPLTDEPAGVAEFRVLGHDRRQAVWKLLQRACEEAIVADWVEL